MSHESSIRETRVLLSGLGMGESPRWHDGRLWFSNWGTNEIVAVDLDGNSEVMGHRRRGQRLGRQLAARTDACSSPAPSCVRVEPDGSRVRHADLSHISPYGWSEITVDGRGNVYVDSLNFDFADFSDVLASGKAPGKIALVTPDGDAREVAGRSGVPERNGRDAGQRHADRRRVVRSPAHRLRHRAPTAACRTGASGPTSRATGSASTPKVPCGAATSDRTKEVFVLRVREGGEVLDRIELDRPCYACMLGGEDGGTLFMVVAKWFGPDRIDELLQAKTGQILTARVDVTHAGWP